MTVQGDWESVIGLEIHTQLATNTKMFCRCRLEFGAPPNTHVCPVCLAHPGVLPVPNEKAIEFAIKIGLALNCSIAESTIFHRKNYFYADSPKAYQISQYDNPICVDGYLDVRGGDGETTRIGITRAHMEEDAAKLVHAGETGRIADSHYSHVDFNRGGTPLVEIVTEPDIRSASQAKEFLTLLKNTLLTVGVSDCNMEEGSLRCDANISVRRRGTTELGTKTELKNMNSFRFLERGIEAEIKRQIELIEAGGTVEQETLHYDPSDGSLRSLRSKEEAHDYRYFPEPDLVPLVISRDRVAEIGGQLPELPAARMKRFVSQYSLTPYDAEVLNGSAQLADLYERVVELASSADSKTVANWTMGEWIAVAKDGNEATAEQLGSIVDLVAEGTISGSVGKELLARVAKSNEDPRTIVESEGLAQVSDEGALRDEITKVLDSNEKQVAQYMAGKTAIAGFFVGQVMKATGGKADPRRTRELVEQMLDERS